MCPHNVVSHCRRAGCRCGSRGRATSAGTSTGQAVRGFLDHVEARRRRVEDAGVGYGAPKLRLVADVLVHPARERHELGRSATLVVLAER